MRVGRVVKRHILRGVCRCFAVSLFRCFVLLMFLCSVGETGFAIRFVLFCFVPCRYVLLFSYGDVVVVVRVIMYVRTCMYACRYIYIFTGTTPLPSIFNA